MLKSPIRPWRWLWLLLAIPLALGLARVRFDVDVLELLPGDLPSVAGLKLYQKHFLNNRELILTLKGESPEALEEAARQLATDLRSLSNEVSAVHWQAPWLEAPAQTAELIAYLWLNQPPETFRELADRLGSLDPPPPAPRPPPPFPPLATRLERVKDELATSFSPADIARLSFDPLGLTQLPSSAMAAAPKFAPGLDPFTSEDGTFRMITVASRAELRNYEDCQRWISLIKARVNALVGTLGQSGSDSSASPSRPPPAVSYTGAPAFVASIAGEMESDLKKSVLGTALIIAVLFWLAHRRFRPLLWLLTLLALTLVSTLALGGLVIGSINIVSMGFAAILLGLAVDYAVVHYQEALSEPGLSIPQIRRRIAPSIFWAALTTIAAFLMLNFAGLPGVAQLGTLVGIGVALAALMMVFTYLPPLFPNRRSAASPARPLSTLSPHAQSGSDPSTLSSPSPSFAPLAPFHGYSAGAACGPCPIPRNRIGWLLSGLALAACLVPLLTGLPRIDASSNALRPRQSEVYQAMDELRDRLGFDRDSLWLIVSGADVDEVGSKLRQLRTQLEAAVAGGDVAHFTLPDILWPNPAAQQANRQTARRLADDRERLRSVLLTHGFAEEAFTLAAGVLDTWNHAAHQNTTYWPTNSVSAWVLNKVVASGTNSMFALGLIQPAPAPLPPFPLVGTHSTASPSEPAPPQPSTLNPQLSAAIASPGVYLTGWESMGRTILERVERTWWKVTVPMVLLVLLSLWLAFPSLWEAGLSLLVLGLGGLAVLAVMKLCGWSWNLLNLMAVPLILGTGVDYGIFMQHALRRYDGQVARAWQSVGKALLLCGATAIAGFGSLGWSNNEGIASLGRVCAVGIAANMLIAIFLLPGWWLRGRAREIRLGSLNPQPSTLNFPAGGPSSLYRARLWRSGLWLVRTLPSPVLTTLARCSGRLYHRFAPHRRRVVIGNLLPAVANDQRRAEQLTGELFQEFALKLVDLWRYEAGLPITALFGATSGWQHFETARTQGRGVLLLTPHLGNWELGGPWLVQKGVSLQVITLAEPDAEFTRLRKESRARWNIDTLVIGHDPFGFLEVIKRLNEGATVALLIDRPPPATAIETRLFGQPFRASIAAAELARATGCALLPVFIPRKASSYEAHILPAVPYERALLRDRAQREQLTARIIQSLEPVIASHLNQWYHFVPVWQSGCECSRS